MNYRLRNISVLALIVIAWVIVGGPNVMSGGYNLAGAHDTQSFGGTHHGVLPPSIVTPPVSIGLSATPLTAPQDTQVNYTATVSGGTPPYTYLWNFGDGSLPTSSTSPIVNHSYAAIGIYLTVVNVSDSAGGHAQAWVQTHTTPGFAGALTANATANVYEGTGPLTVTFTGQALNATGQTPFYEWTFSSPWRGTSAFCGANQSSVISHTFTQSGLYEVALCVSTIFSGSQSAFVNVLVLPDSISASMTASPVAGQAPLRVNFSGTGSGGLSPYQYSWNFGDGSPNSTGQSISHVYDKAGTFTVTLEAIDQTGGSATVTKSITVSPPAPLQVSTSTNVTSGPAPLTVQFNGTVKGGVPPYSYLWNFGDSSFPSAVQNPSHVYSKAGNYTVSLRVTDEAGSTREVYRNITVKEPSPGSANSSSPSLGALGTYGTVLLLAIIAVVAAVSVILIRRRKARGAALPPSQPEPTSTPENLQPPSPPTP